MPTDARTEILARILAAVGGGRSAGLAVEEWVEIPREYRRSSVQTRAELIDQLIDRLHDYDANVVEVSKDELAGAIAARLAQRGVSRVAVPEGFPASPPPEGVEWVVDLGLSAAELESCDGVLSEATLAIAETGTLVLQNVPGQGRRAVSLVPDYHLCVLDAAKVVGSVPEAMDRLKPTAHLTTTFVSGPSATADIEMTRIKGVHGPRFLDVILVS
jgi:L-lactate dehydrogenase complex protein LldG